MDKIDLIKGQNVLLELEDECVIGEILHVGAKRSFVRLRNVRDFQSNLPIAGNQDYYNSEIRGIKIIAGDTCADDGNSSVVSSGIPEQSVARINLEDVQIIFDRIDNHVFVHQTDIRYHDAIKYLKTQKLLALAMEGVEKGRHSVAPSLISVATPERIYVFDIMWMNVTKDLKAILANPKVRRVVHNARLMEDALKYRFGAKLGKCFDTLVAHIATTKDYDLQTELSTQHCLSMYLNLPNNFFDLDISFANRPLNESQRKAAAKNVAFLLTLQDYFVHEIMLEPFYKSCERYGTSLADNSDHEITVSKRRNEDLHDIERFRLNVQSEEQEVDSNE